MATFTTTTDRFPAGTTVTVYPESNWPTAGLPPSGAPIGSSTTSAAVSTASVLTFTGLTENTTYYMTASVGGTYRYVKFRVTASNPDLQPYSQGGSVAQSSLVIPKYDKDNGQAGILGLTAPGWTYAALSASANQARFTRFVPSRDMTISTIAFCTSAFTAGDTADPACDVGIYSSDFTKIVSAGATTGKLNGSAGVKTVGITATPLSAGETYYAAMSVGSLGTTTVNIVTASYTSLANAARLFGTSAGVVEIDFMNTAHPLPTTLTPAGTAAAAYILALREG